MTIYDELKARGLVAQVTDEEEIKELINNGKATFYIGFDPTADSLHVGHFMALMLMRRLQKAGNRPIALIGGGTGMVGDPSGRSDMRSMMTVETIQHNCECFRKQMSKFIDFSEGKALMLNNADWLMKLNYVELLREVGACFSVNNMLRAECYKQRMEKGLSFLEFNYMIMQSYDFYHMFQTVGCNLQCGGDDQWSNMLGGTELIRRKLGKDAYAMTITLLLTSEGKKMGKTQKGAVWLDPAKTTPYEFYQYWRNIGDADVLKCLRMLTDLPLEQIDEMDKWEGAQLNTAKEILAYELTKLVHSEEEAMKAQDAARALFSQGGDKANMPTTTLTADDLADGSVTVLDLMLKCGLAPSKKEARRLVEQGGVEADGVKVTDITRTFAADELSGEGIILKKGKKVYHRALLS
ncbi:tyrosine--tRNA ligase [uncultured Pseudoflavonifractor sp.]|uniref:tyrosine--tRNA ligase n=1 Tax=uncultured Pseudoflavonifractor sp. TaxID=1221379 RepID=UPI0025F1259A|nr:tyrosine--tRNA ligase [uncultured Pseudoflavonifractor sp.]